MRKSLLKLKPYLRPHIWPLIGSFVLAFPLAALRASPAPLIKYAVDDVFVKQDRQKILLIPAVLIGLYLVNFVVRFFHYYWNRLIIIGVHQKIKSDLFEHLLGLSADYYTSQRTGSLISRVGSDPQYIDSGIAAVNVLIREPISFVFIFGYAVYLNWKLTIIILTIFPLLAWVFQMTGRNMKRYTSRMAEENANVFSTLQESFSGFRVLKVFRLEKYVRRKFTERMNTFARYYLKNARLEEAAHPLVELLMSFAIAGVLFYGGNLIADGKMTSGEFFGFAACFGLLTDKIRNFNDINIKLHQASGAADRIFEILNWKTRLYESPNPVKIEGFQREIQFDNVVFAYPDAPERNVLKGVSLTLGKGQCVALVGASGGGKSSLAQLLPRLFDVTQGKILFDGNDIRNIQLEDLRNQLAVVSQDVFLFNDTIEENIRCGRLNATEEEIHKAAEYANALDFIRSLPHGFKTVIGDRGMKLSGGERQRLSIARAFLRNAPILILDEATSSLDTASERLVQHAIDRLIQNKTTLMIAHRLSTVKNADRILVMKDGRVVESGTHSELISKNGEYSKLHQLGIHEETSA